MHTAEFIERVKHFNAIYDRKNINYCNVKEKDRIWRKLSVEFNCDAKKKWSALRDKYVREKKKEIKSEPGTEYTSQWEFYANMNFINEHIKQRRTNGESFFESTKVEDIDDVQTFYNDFCMEITSQNAEDIVKEEPFSKTTYDVKPKIDTVQHTLVEMLKIFHEKLQSIQKSNEEDEDIVFLKLLGNKMKKMTSSEKSSFQLEILKKADEIIIRED